MLGSPKSSARAIQRLGRAGHKLHDTIKGRFIVMDRDDLVECAIIQKEIVERSLSSDRSISKYKSFYPFKAFATIYTNSQ